MATRVLVNQRSGGYASKLALNAAGRALGAALVGLGAMIWIYRYFPTTHHSPVQLAIAIGATALAVVAYGAYRRARSDGRKASVGATSERRVSRVLSRAHPVGLANSLMLGAGGDADHVVVGPWLAVIETKTGRGAVRMEGTTMRAGSRAVPGDPVAQVARQARAVGRLAGTTCDAVVCIVDATTAPFVDRGVAVCSLADLPRVLAQLPHRVAEANAVQMYENLVSANQE